MKNWLDNLKKDIEKFHNTEFGKLTDSEMRRKEGSILGGLMNKGTKHSEETKEKFSKAKLGKKIPKKQSEKSRIGIIKTKWLKLLERYPLQQLLDAQKNNGNHQSNTCAELGISFNSYKKLCKHYGIEKKKSNKEKTQWAVENQSKCVLVWNCSLKKPYRKIGNPKKYKSVSECCNSFEPKLHKGNMLRNMKNKTPYRNMFFEYKK